MSTRQKVRNWSVYNKSLIKRGGIIFNFNQNYLSHLYYTAKQVRGGAKQYSEQMYEYLLTIKVLFRLPWRGTIGFAEGLLKKAFPHDVIRLPDFAHASRSCARLDLKIRQMLPIVRAEGMELAFDSTGISVYTTSGYHQRKHGKNSLYRKKEQWKKIHVAMDLNSMQVICAHYSDSNINDCEAINIMSQSIKGKVGSVRADGAYDTEAFRKIITDWGGVAIIPPASTSKSQDELQKKPKYKKYYLEERDKAIKMIRESASFKEGLKEWKVQSGYHKRSLIEAFMFRLKRTFGFYLHNKTIEGRINEIITKMNLLNLMASFGRAEYST